MNRISSFLFALPLLFAVLPLDGRAQTSSPDPFIPYLGAWAGTLQYLDYSSNDTVSIPVELEVRAIPGNAVQVVLAYHYPAEADHDHNDTLSYAGSPAYSEGLSWKTGGAGRDAGRASFILRSHQWSTNSIGIWKEVQWDHKPGFFLRNRYHFTRKGR
ncbi:hypothetical protein [Flaviaesturariibacter amylovorans]|uniref:DUF1579 domain-containing protein n=1 Tax=Flaviaesturariibacter amylovorans TaxID=1084520 RepID=A0ABP8G5Z2_9BACT